MESGKKWALGGSLVFVLVVGTRLGFMYRERHADDAPVKKVEYKSDPEDLVFLKSEHPISFKDAKEMKGRRLWVSAGGQMDYYAYNGHSADYAHSQGVLLGAEKIDVKDAVEQVAPKKTAFRIPAGDKQVLLVFTTAGETSAGGKEYAVPVGYREGDTYTYSTDQIFFYDDPHQLYSFWGPENWKAIDEHRALVGMNERQVQMALGQVSEPHGDSVGNRLVVYDDQGKPKRVTFAGGKATKIEDVPQ